MSRRIVNVKKNSTYGRRSVVVESTRESTVTSEEVVFKIDISFQDLE